MTEKAARKRRIRIGAAIIAGAATLGVVGASAASLGGITSNSLGADVGVVSSCDNNGVTVNFTNTYDATLGRYQTTTVGVAGIDAACAGKTLTLTLKDNTGVSLGGGSVASIVGTTASVPLTAPGANANAVTGVAIVIAG
jgi:hypothetical protein